LEVQHAAPSMRQHNEHKRNPVLRGKVAVGTKKKAICCM